MKKAIMLLFSVTSLTIATAQEKPHTATQSSQQTKSAAKTTKSPAPAPLTAKDTMLCKAWKITGVEEFGVKNKPNEKQEKDGATFMLENKTAFVTLNGKQITGTWATDKTKTWITVAEDGTALKLKFKLIKVEQNELVYEYQEPEEFVKTLYYFEPAKK